MDIEVWRRVRLYLVDAQLALPKNEIDEVYLFFLHKGVKI